MESDLQQLEWCRGCRYCRCSARSAVAVLRRRRAARSRTLAAHSTALLLPVLAARHIKTPDAAGAHAASHAPHDVCVARVDVGLRVHLAEQLGEHGAKPLLEPAVRADHLVVRL